MTRYEVEVIHEDPGKRKGVSHAVVKGLENWPWDDESEAEPDTWVYLGYFNGTYYGGDGEGRAYPSFRQALLASLYCELQTHCPGNLKEGDEFVCRFRGTEYLYRVVHVHVVSVIDGREVLDV